MKLTREETEIKLKNKTIMENKEQLTEVETKEFKEKSLEVAFGISKLMRGGWFTLKNLSHRMNTDLAQAEQTLVTLNLFSMVAERKDKNKTLYKIIITNSERLKLLREKETQLLDELKEVEKEIKKWT